MLKRITNPDNPEEKCEKINQWLNTLPTFKDPSEVPFNNGLYFFYELGETSRHASKGRIVRVGNHPRSQGGLKKRLRMHYEGNKNSSVFRKSLGSAIIRKLDPTNPCLLPAPGQGHWEKQDMPACPKCKPVEKHVSELLKTNFYFRCIEVENHDLRNSFEEKLVATISLCRVCKPSDGWLGKYAYSDKVKNSGLWNSNYIFEQSKVLTDLELKTLKKLIYQTLRHS